MMLQDFYKGIRAALCSLLCLLPMVVFGKTIQLDLKKNFGAKGDGRTNDQGAFQKAADRINQLQGNCILNIPYGKYVVGGQVEGEKGYRKFGQHTLHLINCRNVVINGNNAEIKFVDNLYLGTFDAAMKKMEPGAGPFNDYKYAAQTGSMLIFSSCNTIKVNNLKLDGNSDTYKLGGRFGDTGYQLYSDGVLIFDSKSVSLKNLQVKNFGRDGLMIANQTLGGENEPEHNILITQCIFDRNGRQGASVVGGKGIYFTDCTFQNTGMGKVYSSPGAGVDIEAEDKLVRKIRFLRCRIINNKGCGYVADSGDSKDVELNECLVIGMDNWSIWNTKPKFKVLNSTIYGCIVHTCKTDKKEDGTVYDGCYFGDSIINGKKTYNGFLMEINESKNSVFRNCVYNTKYAKPFWLEGNLKVSEDQLPLMENCKIYFKAANIVPRDYILIARVIQYRNVSFFCDVEREKLEGKYYQLDRSLDLGGNQYIYGKKK